MGVKRSDFAIREEKDAMLRAVNEISRKYDRIDDAEWTLSASPEEVRAVLKKHSDALKKPMLKFFAGDVMEEIAVQAHEAFIAAIENYISTGQVVMSRQISAQLIDSLRSQIVRNIESFMTNMDANLMQRAAALKEAAAQGAVEAMTASLGVTQLKIESITARTTGEYTDKAWKDLTDKYGSRETVKYRDGKNYPLNTYLDGRANTTATDIHLATTEMDAAQSGVYTGIISKHGASDSCRIWEGKVICFSSEARDLLSKVYPEAANLKTLAEVRADKNSHIFKFNCRHVVTPYPIQFFGKKDAEQFISGSVTDDRNFAEPVKIAKKGTANKSARDEPTVDEPGFTLYHGTSAEAAAGIKKTGFDTKKVYLTPNYAQAVEYADGGEVLKVFAPKKDLEIDLESFDDQDGITIDEAVSRGLSMLSRKPKRLIIK